jgi:hypothetical protein
MKKVVKKITVKNSDEQFDKIEILIEKLATMTLNGFEKVERELKTKASKADILELHDKFASKYEVGQLSLRVSKLEEKK